MTLNCFQSFRRKVATLDDFAVDYQSGSGLVFVIRQLHKNSVIFMTDI